MLFNEKSKKAITIIFGVIGVLVIISMIALSFPALLYV
jgi:hypothetical protein